MIHEKIDVSNDGSVNGGSLYLYLLDGSKEIPIYQRPMVIICPGGAYVLTSDREAEMIAMQFLAFGYHVAVLRYSVAPAVYPAANLELGRSIAMIREHAEEWHIDPDKIAVLGFSAGGHMVASYCMFWKKPFMAEMLQVEMEQLRPNAMMLGYPVITSGEFAHRGSIENLLGDAYEERKEEMSLEHQVSDAVPRSFIWHTFEDGSVPVQNSVLLVQALVAAGIPVEFHLFEKGGHGLALANHLTLANSGFGVEPTCQCWIDMAHAWLENL
mgnify:CR=1 FL=1|jgi:acetyl esterase/lipase